MHQVPYQRELAQMGHSVTLCVDQLMLPERAAMGWQPEDTTGLTLHVASDWENKRRMLEESPFDAVHLISGVRGVNHGGRLTRLAHRIGRRVCWISETWDPRGAKGVLRTLFYRLEAIRYRPCLEKLFAMGDLGVKNYRRIGFRTRQVSPFNYVVPYPPTPAAAHAPDGPFVFGYLGALIPRKRVDLLLRAFASLPNDPILEIHGDGPLTTELRTLAVKLGIENRVRWQGKFPSSEAMARIGRLAALVLPSDFDGWGAVVNEALLCGVPVIASDACGAASLPSHHGWGEVFPAGDATACALACTRVMSNPPAVNPMEVEEAIGPRATAWKILNELRIA